MDLLFLLGLVAAVVLPPVIWNYSVRAVNNRAERKYGVRPINFGYGLIVAIGIFILSLGVAAGSHDSLNLYVGAGIGGLVLIGLVMLIAHQSDWMTAILSLVLLTVVSLPSCSYSRSSGAGSGHRKANSPKLSRRTVLLFPGVSEIVKCPDLMARELHLDVSIFERQ